MAEAFTSGTISGTSWSIRHFDELSMTTQPLAAIFGAHSADSVPDVAMRQMSVPWKS